MPVHRRKRRCSGSMLTFYSHWRQSCPNYIQPLRSEAARDRAYCASTETQGDLTSKAGIQRPQRPPPRGSNTNTPLSLAGAQQISRWGGTASSQFQRTGARVNSRCVPPCVDQERKSNHKPSWTSTGSSNNSEGSKSDPKGSSRHSRRHTDRHQNLGHVVAVKNYSSSCQHRLCSIIRNGDTQYPLSTSGETTKTSTMRSLSYSGLDAAPSFPALVFL